MITVITLPDLKDIEAKLEARFHLLYAEWRIAEKRGLLKEGDPKAEEMARYFHLELDEIETGLAHVANIAHAIREGLVRG